MARRKILAGSTSVVVPIFIQDSSSTTGAGLGSLVYNSAGLAAKYRRQGDSSWTTINLVTATAGTFTSSGFIADGGPVTGGYELGIPNAALASGATWVQIALYGATNMLAVLLEIELDAVNYQDATRFGLSALPNASAGANGGLPTVNGNNAVLIQTGTGTGQLDFTSGVVKANATQILGGTIPTPNTTGVPLVDTKYVGGTLQTARDIGASVLLSVGTGSGQVNLSSGKVPATIAAGDLATDSITAAALKADAVSEIQSGLMLASSYTAPDNSTISSISTTIGAAGAGLTALGDTRLANLDAAVSTRLATAGYTAPDNASASSAASSAATAATQATNAASQTTAANIRTAVGLAAANLDSQLGAIPTTFRLKKNTAFSGFSLVMFNTSGVAATGKTVSGSVSIDGAAFGTLTNSVSEIGSGAYKVNLAAADTNGNDLLFLFTATDCKPLFLKVITQP